MQEMAVGDRLDSNGRGGGMDVMKEGPSMQGALDTALGAPLSGLKRRAQLVLTGAVSSLYA